jgi:hypothetical protein
MQVVEDHDEWPAGGEAFEQRADRPMQPEPLVAPRSGPARPKRAVERREGGPQLRGSLLAEVFEDALVDALEVVVDGVDPDAVWKVAFELRRAAAQDERRAIGGAVREVAEQGRLPDAGLADDLHRDARAAKRLLECVLDSRPLDVSADDRRAGPVHVIVPLGSSVTAGVALT